MAGDSRDERETHRRCADVEHSFDAQYTTWFQDYAAIMCNFRHFSRHSRMASRNVRSTAAMTGDDAGGMASGDADGGLIVAGEGYGALFGGDGGGADYMRLRLFDTFVPLDSLLPQGCPCFSFAISS